MRQIISTSKAPAAIGPYSQAIKFTGPMLSISGQIPIDPETGDVVQGDIKIQTKRAMDNLKAILIASGCMMHDVLKTTIYLTNMNDFQAVNEVYGTYFPQAPPTRATVQVSGLPKGVAIEIEALALVPDIAAVW
jgi:2-iminobutanoate/2-iminopropanoate deaminase